MLSVRTVEILTSLLTIGIAYIISATTAGYIQAWAAKKLGDDTPEMAGFLTWNPLVHIDPIGALCLFLLGVGWSRLLPIDPSFIKGKIRLFLIFLTKPLTYVVIACISLLLLLKIFGFTVLNIAMVMVIAERVSLPALASAYPHSSSLILSIAVILVMMIYIGVLFAVLDFILGCFRFAQYTYLRYLAYSPVGMLLEFLIAFLAILFFAGPLKVFVVRMVITVAYFLAPFLGAS